MSRNIPIKLVQGESKVISFSFNDTPNLLAADIHLRVKLFLTDDADVIDKIPKLELSPNLATGEFIIQLLPEDTADLDPRTYHYELSIDDGVNVLKPLVGDFVVYSGID